MQSIPKINLDINNDVLLHMPGYVCWKDINLVLLGANLNLSRALNFKNPYDIIGKSDHEFPSIISEYADTITDQDKAVLRYHRSLRFLEIIAFSERQTKIVLTTKSPVFNKNNHIIGTVVHALDIKDCLTARIGNFLFQSLKRTPKRKSFLINDIPASKPNLTKRQLEVLFHLLRGKSAKESAGLLSISARTVEAHIECLKDKFLCKQKSALIDKAISLGFQDIIPESILQKMLN